MTHFELFQQLIDDDNIADNIDVQDGYEKDVYGNNIITLSFEGVAEGKKKGANGMVILLFNESGRLVNMQIATKQGKKDWQVAVSQIFANFSQHIKGIDQ